MSAPASDFPQLGRYQVIDRIATGGMAEVFLARSVGAMGFQRLVAVKLIHANFTRDQEFVKMFIDEARIAMHLHHRNIVQVIDLDKVDGTYFLAMEFVRGVNLYDLYERIAGQGRWVEIPMALYLVAEICKGLHFAHTRNGPDGRPLGIVHRDVSPQNVLLSFEGEVKITDFGIATAAERLHQTAAGIVKGKYAYMAPERLREQASDARVDVFSAGVLLYELLVGENPFAGNSAVETIEAVLSTEVPAPSSRGAAVPSRLDRICAKALAKDPEERWPSAQALADALTELAMELTYARKEMASGDAGIAQLLGELFPEERARRVGEGKSGLQLPGVAVGPVRDDDDPNALEDTARPGTKVPPGLPALDDADSGVVAHDVEHPHYAGLDDLDAPTLLRASPFYGGNGAGPATPVGTDGALDPTAPTAVPNYSPQTPSVQAADYDDDEDDPDAMTLPAGEDATAQMSAVPMEPRQIGAPVVDPSAETWLPPAQPPVPLSPPPLLNAIPDPAERLPPARPSASQDLSAPPMPARNSGVWVASILLVVAAVLCAAAVFVALRNRGTAVQIVEVPLELRSSPPGATVTIDGRSLPNPTPTRASVLGGQPLDVRFTLEGHQAVVERFIADPRRGGQLLVTLPPKASPPPLEATPKVRKVTLRTKGRRPAQLYREGKALGRTPLTVELPVGTITLEATLSGRKQPRNLTIKIPADGPEEITLPL